MKYLLILLLISFSTKNCGGETLNGRDLLALQSVNWEVKASTKHPVEALGTLDWTFGTKTEAITKVIDAWKPKVYRVHIINTVCIRNQNCGKYEVGYGYTKASFDQAVKDKKPSILKHLRERVRIYRTIADVNPNTKLLISPALEHDLSQKAWRVLANTVLDIYPEVQLVNSPDLNVQGERYKGAWIERHGSNPQADADIVSLDGTDATQINLDSFLKRTYKIPGLKVLYLWSVPDNCRIETWQDPRVRNNCATEKTLELMTHLFTLTPKAPMWKGSCCDTMSQFKDPDIWKPLAEGTPNEDPREQLPVLITSGFKKSSINILDCSGNKQGVLGFYGSYQGTQNRWYSGYEKGSSSSGYNLQASSELSMCSGFVWLEQNRHCKGPFFPGRRQGKYKDN